MDLVSRRKAIDAKIEKLDVQIKKLQAEKKELVLVQKSLPLKQDTPKVIVVERNKILVAFLERFPGSSKEEIRAFFSALSENEITNLLSRARRGGLIKNEGTRSNPEWVLTKE